jgi:DNA-binding CsgD family transcriptional regulator
MEQICNAERFAAALPSALVLDSQPRGAGVGLSSAALLMRVLDEIDYGLLLVSASGSLRCGNQLGLHEVSGGGPLQLERGRLQSRAPSDQVPLHAALNDAARGRRRLFSVGHNGGAISVAAVPMSSGDDEPGEPTVLLVFGKRNPAETLTVDFYARSHGLTGAETNVLKCICSGKKPKEIARDQGVAISTVRSHICSIRIKTQTSSIRDLVNRVAVLPPITPAMKTSMGKTPVH